MLRLLFLISLISLAHCFTFHLVADPQLGSNKIYDSKDWSQHSKYNFVSYNQVIHEINNDTSSAFVIINGDLVGKGRSWNQYINFINITKQFRKPLKLVFGNHDGDTYENFIKTQLLLNTTEIGEYYGFDYEAWHFIVIPWIYEDYNNLNIFYQWLEQEVEDYRNSNILVLAHSHYMPMGMLRLESYSQSLPVRQRITDTLLRYGNVKYWIGGHVHSSIMNSIKTAWFYRNCVFLVAPTVVVPRPYDEEYDGFNYGKDIGGYYLRIVIDRDEVSIYGHLIYNDDEIKYPNPDQIRVFEDKIEPRWNTYMQDLPTSDFINGGFEDRLFQGWIESWPYSYGKDRKRDSDYADRDSDVRIEGNYSAFLQVKSLRSKWNGGEAHEIYQIIPSTIRSIRLNYYVRKLSRYAGGYIRLHGYMKNSHVSTCIFYFGNNATKNNSRNIGNIFAYTAVGNRSLDTVRDLLEQRRWRFIQINDSRGFWHSLNVDLASVLPGEIDKLAVILGVWVGSDPGSLSRVHFDNVTLSNEAVVTANDGIDLSMNDGIYDRVFMSRKLH